MTIEHPRFPTPEDERTALLLYEALRKSAEFDNDIPPTAKPAEAGPCVQSRL